VVTNHEMTWKRVDGSQFPVMINVRVDRHGLELRFEGFVVDITDRKHADAARLRSSSRPGWRVIRRRRSTSSNASGACGELGR